MKRIQIAVACSLVVFMMLSACGSKENAQTSDSSQETQSVQADKASKTNSPKSNFKGQKITVDQFTFVIPKDWKENKGTGVWFPPTEDSNRPLPAHSLHQGARPLMGISELVKGIESHIGVEPVDKKATKVGNMQGIVCKWQLGSYKSVGLFLLEKSPAMPIMYFFICQAPATSFDDHVDTYHKILETVSVK